MKKILLLLLFLPLLAADKGCSNIPIEKVAYRTIVGAKGYTDSVKKNHPECVQNNPPSTPTCGTLLKTIAGKDSLIDAVEVYCSNPQFESGQECKPDVNGPDAKAAAYNKLNAALLYYNQTEGDLKKLVGKK